MHIEFDYNGKTYIGRETKELIYCKSFDAAVKSFFNNIGRYNTFSLELTDGSVMIIAQDVIKHGVFRFYS